MSIKIGNNILAKSSTYHPDLFDIKWADHILNNVSWLRADTFSWHYASMYPRVYQHLYSDIAQQGVIQYYGWTSTNNVTLYTTSENPAIGDTVYNYVDQTMSAFVVLDDTMEATSLYIKISTAETDIYTRDPSTDTVIRATETEVVAGISIQYFLASDGHKVVAPEYTEAVNQIYNATGSAWYYIIDTKNKRFKLPRKRSSEIVNDVNYGNRGYKLYADGWVEQWGHFDKGSLATDTTHTIDLALPMRNTNYTLITQSNRNNDVTSGINNQCFIIYRTTSQFKARCYGDGTSQYIDWWVRGKASQSPDTWEANEKYLYLYVGDYTQASVENIAGINTELFNTKADLDMIQHVVVETMEPTADNNYTWYRKYSDGWVEQGGVVTNSGDSTFSTVTLPVKMNSTNYTVTATQKSNITSMPNTCFAGYYIQSDQVVLIGNRGISGEYARTQSWEVKGMAA